MSHKSHDGLHIRLFRLFDEPQMLFDGAPHPREDLSVLALEPINLVVKLEDGHLCITLSIAGLLQGLLSDKISLLMRKTLGIVRRPLGENQGFGEGLFLKDEGIEASLERLVLSPQSACFVSECLKLFFASIHNLLDRLGRKAEESAGQIKPSKF